MNNVIYRNNGNKDFKYGMILIHGRGAFAEDILSLYDELGDNEFLAAAPQAPGSTWYPYSFLAPVENNEPFLSSSLNLLKNLISEFSEKGIPEKNILLIGFSQGACLCLEYIFRNPEKYGGVAALSGALISTDQPETDFKGTPVFLGCSQRDPHIPLYRVEESSEFLTKRGALVTKKIYPGASHSVNHDEIGEIKKIVEKLKKT